MKAQASHKDVAIWCDNGHVLELDIFGFDDFASTLQDWKKRGEGGEEKWNSGVLLAFSPVVALLTSAFSNFPFRTSFIVSRRRETRAV